MPEYRDLVAAIAAVARDWREPAYPPRSAAVEATLQLDYTFTEEAVAFAVNQQMSLLTEESLTAWIGGRSASKKSTVGVLNAGNLPFVDLQDYLAVVLTGHRYLGVTSSRSSVLLPSFVDDVRKHLTDLEADFTKSDAMFRAADAVLATGSDETMQWVEEKCLGHGIDRLLVRGSGFAVAVLGGREKMDDFEHLAEDILLHEGYGCRNVAIIWAPRGTSPDQLLDALAHFRGVFPSHPSAAGRLKMQQAFLAAVDTPHAYGEGLEFLLSKGPPEVQLPGHVRWTEFDDLDEINSWLKENGRRVQLVVADHAIASGLKASSPVVRPGQAQRPELTWCPGGEDTVEFLCRIG